MEYYYGNVTTIFNVLSACLFTLQNTVKNLIISCAVLQLASIVFNKYIHTYIKKILL